MEWWSTKDRELLRRVAYLRYFGYDGYERSNRISIKCLNSNFHAIMGLAVFQFFHEISYKRKAQADYYIRWQAGLPLQRQIVLNTDTYNLSNYSVLLSNEEAFLAARNDLDYKVIGSRGYFYPSLSSLDCVTSRVPIASDIAKRELCLPVHHSLTMEDQVFIANTIKYLLIYIE